MYDEFGYQEWGQRFTSFLWHFLYENILHLRRAFDMNIWGRCYRTTYFLTSPFLKKNGEKK